MIDFYFLLPSQFSNTFDYNAMNVSIPESPVQEPSCLTTIDTEVLRQVCEGGSSEGTQSDHEAAPSTPAESNPVNESDIEVREELIRTCVTPTKVRGVERTLGKEEKRDKCALKLLPYFFNRDELATSNTDGTHGKKCLDASKLNSLKVLVFSKFPVNSSLQKDKVWRAIKCKINAKCRASKFATARESQDIRGI